MNNASQISQPHWKVRVVDFVARALGILVHVEGMPFGSSRNMDFSKGYDESSSGAAIGNPFLNQQ